jgi:hypothetical protein
MGAGVVNYLLFSGVWRIYLLVFTCIYIYRVAE